VPASPGKGEACIGDFFNFDFKDVGAAVVGFPSPCLLFKTPIGLFVPHRKHIRSPL
jgi:hypothetical protein